MKSNTGIKTRWLLRAAASFAIAGLLVGCSSSPQALPEAPAPSGTSAAVAPPTIAKSPASPAAAATPTPLPLKLLKVQPDKGKVGDSFSITGEGLPPSKEVQFQWKTVDGGFDTKVFTETIEFYERKFTDKRMSLGRAATDAQGRLTATLTAPDDYGEVHDIYVTVDGQDVARGGYRILPEFTMTPLEGPVGTPITIRAKGIGWKNWESTWGVNWDNKYTGFITAITTRGTATAVIRASGPVGLHTVDVWHAGQTVPYLNWEQSPQSHIPIFQYMFKVVEGSPPPPLTLEWPDKGRATVIPTVRTTATNPASTSGAPTAITPTAGPILSTATLRATNLPPNANVDLFFVTARGSRTSGLGWGLADIPLGTAMTKADGTLTKEFQVPDDLGGWHTVKIVQGDKTVAEAPFLVQPSLVGVTPTRVKLGENFTINIKGVGWTEIDNIYTVVYDNSYVGFACGFNSNGDVTVNLRASGGRGVHLIDLYPTTYQGHGKPPWLYDTPQLTALQDHPGLSLGYQMPIFRLAIEVID
ncbi:MAG: hypothetical protein HY673_00655 [Chloroflexi bacterium]|nr:hypothetical protein [Chloroflexota bacterium]